MEVLKKSAASRRNDPLCLNGTVEAAYERAAAARLSYMWGYAPLKDIRAAAQKRRGDDRGRPTRPAGS
jgi:hypothetical protein